MAMLFLVFLDIPIHGKIVQKLHLKILAANIFIPCLVFFALRFLDEEVAVAVFLIALAPTAAAAPIIARLLNAKVEIVAASTLVTSMGMALVIPFLLPFLVQIEGEIYIADILLPVFIVVFIPFILAQIVKWILPRLHQFFSRQTNLPLYFFLVNVYLAMAKSTNFLQTSETGKMLTIFWIALATGGLCLLNFQVGERIGLPALQYEGGLALGRKNTMFILWVALTFISPIAALSPIFYILWQNLYNSWQLWQKK